jgi:hypothetical protein
MILVRRTYERAPIRHPEPRRRRGTSHLLKCRRRVRPHPDFEDGVRYMRVVQAVADSRARNEWVEIKH